MEAKQADSVLDQVQANKVDINLEAKEVLEVVLVREVSETDPVQNQAMDKADLAKEELGKEEAMEDPHKVVLEVEELDREEVMEEQDREASEEVMEDPNKVVLEVE